MEEGVQDESLFPVGGILLLFALVPFVPAWLDWLYSETETKQVRPAKAFRQTLAQGVQIGVPDKPGLFLFHK